MNSRLPANLSVTDVTNWKVALATYLLFKIGLATGLVLVLAGFNAKKT